VFYIIMWSILLLLIGLYYYD